MPRTEITWQQGVDYVFLFVLSTDGCSLCLMPCQEHLLGPPSHTCGLLTAALYRLVSCVQGLPIIVDQILVEEEARGWVGGLQASQPLPGGLEQGTHPGERLLVPTPYSAVTPSPSSSISVLVKGYFSLAFKERTIGLGAVFFKLVIITYIISLYNCLLILFGRNSGTKKASWRST